MDFIGVALKIEKIFSQQKLITIRIKKIEF